MDTQQEPKLAGKRILWVEDDPFLKDIITKKLSMQNFVLFLARNSDEAFRLIELEKAPDVIMLDVLLSGVDGFEILRQLKENLKVKHVPVILLSNLGQQADIDRSNELGAAKFLVKATLTLDEIIEEIKKVLRDQK